MATTGRYLATRFREMAAALSRRWGKLMPQSRTVLALTTNFGCRSSLRVLSLEEGWRILFADSLEDGLRLQCLNRASILVYDHDLPGVDWRRGVRTLLSEGATFPIVIADPPSSRLRSEVLDCGGFDVARNPLEPACLAALVNGAWALTKSIDNLEACPGMAQIAPCGRGSVRG
jgi:DNA-binding response OmpR family regulator